MLHVKTMNNPLEELVTPLMAWSGLHFSLLLIKLI